MGGYADLGFDLSEIPEGDGIVVFPHALAPVHEVIVGLTLPGSGKRGIFDRNFEDPDHYRPVDATVPTDRPYRIQGLDPGTQFRGVPPREAVPMLGQRHRRNHRGGPGCFHR